MKMISGYLQLIVISLAWPADDFIMSGRVRITSGWDASPQTCAICKVSLNSRWSGIPPSAHPSQPCFGVVACTAGIPGERQLGLGDINLLNPLQCWGSQCSQKRKWGQRREDLTLCFCLLFQIKPFPYKRHTPCSPNISWVSISGNGISSKPSPSMRLYLLSIAWQFNIETPLIVQTSLSLVCPVQTVLHSTTTEHWIGGTSNQRDKSQQPFAAVPTHGCERSSSASGDSWVHVAPHSTTKQQRAPTLCKPFPTARVQGWGLILWEYWLWPRNRGCCCMVTVHAPNPCPYCLCPSFTWCFMMGFANIHEI